MTTRFSQGVAGVIAAITPTRAKAERTAATLPLLAVLRQVADLIRDGAHLITPDLERRVAEIARHFPGFFIGRFDVRYRNVADFMAGHDLAIVELNGATSESTNIYDPSWSLLRAYRTLYRQWMLLYRIGAENCRLGHASTGLVELLRLVFHYSRSRRIDPLAD